MNRKAFLEGLSEEELSIGSKKIWEIGSYGIEKRSDEELLTDIEKAEDMLRELKDGRKPSARNHALRLIRTIEEEIEFRKEES